MKYTIGIVIILIIISIYKIINNKKYVTYYNGKKIKEPIDYTGKLNNHKDYIDILNKIDEKCEYIEVVIIDGTKTNKLIEKFKENVIDVKKVSEWWGTKIDSDEPCNYLYKLKYDKKIYSYLSKFETFCKYYEYGTTKKSITHGDYSEITDFGIDDIAFYDNEDNYLLWTTTHEGYILINESLIKKSKSK